LFSGVGSLAPAALFFAIELVRRLLGPPRLACRTTAHDQPDQHDEEDRRTDDVDDPPLGYVHAFLPSRGTAAPIIAYIARNGALGFLDRVPPRRHIRALGGRVDRSFAAAA